MRGRRGAGHVNVFPFRRLDLGPFATVKAEVEDQIFCFPVGLPLPSPLLDGVYSAAWAWQHGPMSGFHRRQVEEFCVLEIHVSLAR